MEIRILKTEEIPEAVQLARYVFANTIQNYIKETRTVEYFHAYMEAEKLIGQVESGNLTMWGAFEKYGKDKKVVMAGVCGLDRRGLITMIYVHPFFQHRHIGRKMLMEMRCYACTEWNLPRIFVNATPPESGGFFGRYGFTCIGDPMEENAVARSMVAKTKYIKNYPRKKLSLWASLLLTAGFLLAALGSGLAFWLL